MKLSSDLLSILSPIEKINFWRFRSNILIPISEQKIENSSLISANLRLTCIRQTKIDTWKRQHEVCALPATIQGKKMFMTPNQNRVRIAVDRLGGPTKASNQMGVSNNTISTWIKKQRVGNIDFARKLAELSKMTVQDLRETE